MMVIDDCSFVPGVWGPYKARFSCNKSYNLLACIYCEPGESVLANLEKHAVTENTFLLEGGQTSAGSTMDWIVKTVGKTFVDFANIQGWG